MKQMRAIRKSLDITQKQLAKFAGVSQSFVVQIENGGRKPSVKVAKRIASILGFDWTDFFKETA